MKHIPSPNRRATPPGGPAAARAVPRLLALGWLVAFAACAHAGAQAQAPLAANTRAAPAAADPATPGLRASDAAVADGRAPGPLALGAFEVQVPACVAEPSPAEARFCASAARAVRAAYEDDDDDPSRLMALSNAVEVQVDLGRLAADWRAPLGHALARSEGLQRIGPTLRALRRAVADAYLDQVSRIYRGVNTEACRVAFAQLPADEPHWLEMVVTVEPLGTYPLARLRRFCLDSRTLARAERKLPGVAADAATRAAVLAAWPQDVRKNLGEPVEVRVLGGWRDVAGTPGETRELVVGAARPPTELAAAGLDTSERCHLARLLLSRRTHAGAVGLRWVEDEGPVACRTLWSATAAHGAHAAVDPRALGRAHRVHVTFGARARHPSPDIGGQAQASHRGAPHGRPS